ncbi:Glutamate/Leucine/Phenylalanine/Valine dehydrogenase family protein [Babesia bovis T2Bo]|uniref:Glutamate/Leucine/Phenylalanine/Valine dehydrogenase family protein n=1 Tax=Babesia bovis TaxID=5865 RepID=A7APP0_BABBO|nr:Glutamate/Leucine/Phenylalanine/Valine dehydrogenase family protein [Babesia bovis T2Bo]EDO08524.1 Glutamate/Leucine/Phenylalanine/Valine dehydrogenase family protein [Babesia bovis T2Bo]|eukprot:XP_001612092.1 Glutamate/Leucine/Phenylalanine/Valine dehydrogenase family protein [Babesia bovis T2Bo]
MAIDANLDNYLHDDGLSGVVGSDETHDVPLSDRYATQFQEVYKIVKDLKTFSDDTINQTMDQYYNKLGLNEYYFSTSNAKMIANNMVSVLTAKILHENSGSDYFPLIEQVHDGRVFIITRASLLNHKLSQIYAVEKTVEQRFLHFGDVTRPVWRMQCFRSTNSMFDDPANLFERLRIYFFQLPNFAENNPEPGELRLSKLLDKDFYKNKRNTITEDIFYKLNKQIVMSDGGIGLVMNGEPREFNTFRIDVAFRQDYVQSDFYSRFGDCVTYYGCYSKSKYVDPLSNNVCIITAFITSLPSTELDNPDLSLLDRAHSIMTAIRLCGILPHSHYLSILTERLLNGSEMAYAYCASIFVEHFSGSVGPHMALIERLATREQMAPSELYDIRSKLMIPSYLPNQIFEAVQENIPILKQLHKNFCILHNPDINPNGTNTDPDSNALKETIKTLDNQVHAKILSLFLTFNSSTLRTNFFVTEKSSFAFRLDPSFLSKNDYPETPYGIVMLMGPFFRGFHIRFSEISRGGIRVVQSFSHEAFTRNKLQVFDEAYNLSYTQSLKNKDIPEGGSKGVILLDKAPNADLAQIYTRNSFMCYVDGLLDVMMPCAQMVDHLHQDEIYFLGPDEHTGTGRLMDWAANHAKLRGFPFWRSFTTGKEPVMGGIPHDTYGMTTASIEAYIHELLNIFHLNEEEVTRFLTGGPDGDLGSNALLCSKTKTLTVIDKSGVLHDPEGLDINELQRLAANRLKGLPTSAMHYNEALLSDKGFKVPEDAVDMVLPDGTKVKRGHKFRDEFHLGACPSDLFNPCGGRPSSITPFNVNRLFDEKGKCIYKFIVEGANVFITQDARRILENKGVILFKDASTNKGGVTSSSFEVLAALVLDDDTFDEMMTVKEGGEFPQFRKDYINEILDIIKKNARREFHALWNEGLRIGMPRCDLTDVLSTKIIRLKKDIIDSNSLWEDTVLVRAVLSKAIPQSLQKLVPIEDIMVRLPDRYMRSMFASHLASTFYYSQQFTDDTSVFAFYEYLKALK